MPSALDMFGSDTELQNHWIRRIVAIIIDAIIIWVIWWVFSLIVSFGTIFHGYGYWLGIGFFHGIIWFLYSAILEGIREATIGKMVLNLRVVSNEGPFDMAKAFIRNISKIFWVFLLLDWIVGFVTEGDPRQRFLDRIGNTTVIRTDIGEHYAVGRGIPLDGPPHRRASQQRPHRR